ncbi:MAG: HAMP domain-containing histidine kinase [Nocardioides sp.]|nr:HAMP domain-containing histidine kinase [Nocardioides sp.]
MEVAAELSDDLRVPLTSIIASIELLEHELGNRSEPSLTGLLGRAARAGDRMARMLDQHLTPPGAFGSVVLPEVDLAEVVRAVVRAVVRSSADLLEPVGAVVETAGLPVVRADPDAMYSVLQNLLVNSVKFARPGVPPQVRVHARRVVGGWRVGVRDNGRGLPETSGLNVPTLFSRGTSTITGNGIGLATVARIVAEHGGRVGTTRLETGAEI